MNLPDYFTNPPFVWFVIGIVLALLELAVPGLIIIFFAFGAILVSILSYFIDMDVAIQIMLFVIASVSSLVLLRKKLKTRFFLEGKNSSTSEDDEFTGQQVTVIEDILPNQNGKVEFKGANWKAKSDAPIKAGSTAQIIGKESICLIVKPI